MDKLSLKLGEIYKILNPEAHKVMGKATKEITPKGKLREAIRVEVRKRRAARGSVVPLKKVAALSASKRMLGEGTWLK